MKYKLFVLTILSSVGFFNYRAMLSVQMVKAIFYLNVIMCLVLALREGVSLKKVQYPRMAYAGLLAGICVSAVMASAFHSQSLVTSVITTAVYVFSYGFFWILMKLDIPRRKVLNAYIWLCAASTVVYFCNVATMPLNIFGEPIIGEDTSRGILRLPVVFIQMFPLLVFYGINQYLVTKEKKWWLLIAWCLMMVFLCVIRQVIALTLVLSAWFLFRSVSAYKKVLLAMAAMAIVVFVMPQIPIFKTMIELSEDQRDSNEKTEDIRITAWRYYTYDNQTNALTPFFGNGVPAIGGSPWGQMFDSETKTNGCLTGDVGWAGFFWHFGGIATLCLIIMLAKAFLKPKNEKLQYLNYWILYLSITSVASGPIWYYWEIVCVVVVLYLVFKKSDDDEPLPVGNDTGKALDDSREPSLLQKYPQIR